MANITLFVSDSLKKRMDEREDIRWSKAIRSIIEEKMDDYEQAEALAKKSRLTEKDAEEFAQLADAKAARRAEALLNETRSRR